MKKFLALTFLFFLLLLIIAFYQAMSTPLKEFPRETIKLGEQELKVAVAEDPELKRQGLRGVEDLGELDGMLFVYSEPVQGSFTMKDTLIPLKIGFYSSDGTLVNKKEMEPCSEDCKSYDSKEEFQYALEVPLNSEINLNSKLSNGY